MNLIKRNSKQIQNDHILKCSAPYTRPGCILKVIEVKFYSVKNNTKLVIPTKYPVVVLSSTRNKVYGGTLATVIWVQRDQS